MTNPFITAFDLYSAKKCPSNLFRLSGKTLAEWARELNMDTTTVLALLAELKKQGKIADVEFV